MPDIAIPVPAETRPAATADAPVRTHRGPGLRAGVWVAWLAELSRPRSEAETRARLIGQLQG